MKLQDVVDGSDEGPFVCDLGDAPREELPEAAGLFDLAEHRLGALLSEAVAAAPSAALEALADGLDPQGDGAAQTMAEVRNAG